MPTPELDELLANGFVREGAVDEATACAAANLSHKERIDLADDIIEQCDPTEDLSDGELRRLEILSGQLSKEILNRTVFTKLLTVKPPLPTTEQSRAQDRRSAPDTNGFTPGSTTYY